MNSGFSSFSFGTLLRATEVKTRNKQNQACHSSVIHIYGKKNIKAYFIQDLQFLLLLTSLVANKIWNINSWKSLLKQYNKCYLPEQLKHPRITSVLMVSSEKSQYFIAAEPQWDAPNELGSIKQLWFHCSEEPHVLNGPNWLLAHLIHCPGPVSIASV